MRINSETPVKEMKNYEKLAQVALEKGMTSLVLLEGQAPTQYNDHPVNISGIIDTPSRFINGRGDEFVDAKKHCLVSRSKGEILLVINEKSVIEKYLVQGQIQVSNKFKALGINDENTTYTPEQLANKLKLQRSLFVKNLEHSNICSTLRNLKANVNRDINQADDRRGNVERSFKQTVESNMPEAITLKLPLIEGGDIVQIKVNVVLEAEGLSNIKCSLESVEAAEFIEELFNKKIDAEIEKIKHWVTVIEH